MDFGLTDLVILLAAVVLVIGVSRIPKIAHSLWAAYKEARAGMVESDPNDTIHRADG